MADKMSYFSKVCFVIIYLNGYEVEVYYKKS